VKSSRKSPRAAPAIKLINLEEGMPLVHEAVARLNREIATAKQQGHTVVKLIHGYGSSGVGGDIRIAVQKRLRELRESRQIHGYVFGEDWTISNEDTWHITRKNPELKEDRDLGRKNLGITILLL
jgi:hypothetical protein